MHRNLHTLVITTALLLACPAAASAATIGVWGVPASPTDQQTLLDNGATWAALTPRAQPDVSIIPGFHVMLPIQRTMPTATEAASANTFEDDEPNMRLAPLTTIAKQQRAVRALHRRLVVTLAAQAGGVFERGWVKYSAYGNILAFDSYPTAQYPRARIGVLTRRAVSLAHGRPVWADLEICSRKNFATGVVPSVASYVHMIRAAEHNGASVVWFFGGQYQACLAAGETWDWHAWSNIQTAIQEVSSNT